MKRCRHCWKKFERLSSHIFVLPDGTQMKMDDACDDCITIHTGHLEIYLNATAN